MRKSAFLAAAVFTFTCCACSVSHEQVFESEQENFEQVEKLGDSEAAVPRESEAHFAYIKGELALNEERFDDALRYFEEAAAIEKNSAPVLRQRIAQLYVRQGKLQEALAQLEKVGPSKDPDLLELKAGILATLKQVPEAIATYRTLIELSPSKPNEDVYVLLASLYAENGDLASAKRTLEELLSRSKDSVHGNYYLARVTEASGDVKDAERLYKRALALSPNSEPIKLDLARFYGSQKRFSEGAALCKELLKANPQNIAARQLLGQLLLGDNKVDEALEQLEKLGRLEDDPSETRFKIALIKLERRDFDGAETELNLITAKDPENTSARYYLALAYAGNQRSRDALLQLQKIGPEDKLFVESRILSAYLYRQAKKFDEAIEVLRSGLAVKKNEPRLLNFLTSVLREAQRPKEAVETLRQLIAVEPKNDANYFMLGVLHDELGDKEQAIKVMRQAVEINPKNADALNYLGYTLAELDRDLDEAEKLIRAAMQIDARNGYYVDSLGWVHFKRKRYQEALQELTKAVELVSNDAVILEHFALAQQQTGKPKEALATARKALEYAPASDDKEVGARLKALIVELEQTLGD